MWEVAHNPGFGPSDQMAWYFVSLNLFFAVIVVGAIVAMHGWAIATQSQAHLKSL